MTGQVRDEYDTIRWCWRLRERAWSTLKLAEHILESSLLANEEKKSASDVAANAIETDDKKAKKRSFLKKIFLPTEQMKFSYPVLKRHIWMLPIFHVVRWVQVLFTRPQAIGQLKKMNDVEEADLAYMKEIRGGLGINHL